MLPPAAKFLLILGKSLQNKKTFSSFLCFIHTPLWAAGAARFLKKVGQKRLF
jgi:hypothetical protein